MASSSTQTVEVLEREVKRPETVPVVRPVPEPERKPEPFVIKVLTIIPY